MAHIVKVVDPPKPPHDCWQAIGDIDGQHLGIGSIANCCGRLYIKTRLWYESTLHAWERYKPPFPGETDDPHRAS